MKKFIFHRIVGGGSTMHTILVRWYPLRRRSFHPINLDYSSQVVFGGFEFGRLPNSSRSLTRIERFLISTSEVAALPRMKSSAFFSLPEHRSRGDTVVLYYILCRNPRKKEHTYPASILLFPLISSLHISRIDWTGAKINSNRSYPFNASHYQSIMCRAPQAPMIYMICAYLPIPGIRNRPPPSLPSFLVVSRVCLTLR